MSLPGLILGVLLLSLTACGPSVNRYALIEESLRANDPKRADAIVEQAEKEYGAKSRVLYGMDRGMTLHLAGEYERSNAVLEQAEDEVERLYTRKVRTETAAFLTNDNALPYEGDPYEQVMINVVKALNYALLGQPYEALVEARRLDHRLNLLADRAKDKTGYRDDGFARYLSGILFEAAGDLNNAFIAYRKAYEAYDAARAWSHTPVPRSLRTDLLRVTESLHLTAELEEYRRLFPEETSPASQSQGPLAQVVVISYNGRAPKKEDQFLDLPISLDALQLVLLNRALAQGAHQNRRAVDSVLYGLNGRVVRVALPRLVPQKTGVAGDSVVLVSDSGDSITGPTELVHNVTALAEKSLMERLPSITAKALARAAVKFTMAEGVTRGAQQAAGKDHAAWVGLAVGLLAKGLAVASEEADKRSWQTLPDEIHLVRLWVPAGTYEAHMGRTEAPHASGIRRRFTVGPGETTFLVQRVIQ